MDLLQVKTDVDANCDGLFMVREQVITDDLIDELQSERLAKTALRAADFDRVASVPAFVWELWMRQGRDPLSAPARDIVKWLREDDLHYFISTPKSV